jgi:cytochrome c oxidase assembly protein subunit 15
MNKFKRFAWILVYYSLFVILWGAWVRISHSGDGCGASWPLCDGQAIPENIDLKKFIEFFHRLKSGLFGILVVVLDIWARRIFPKGHRARKFATLSLIFTISEALLGAVLVKAGLVASNDSPLRALVMASHLLNSMALVAFLTLTADYSSKLNWQKLTEMPWSFTKVSRRKLFAGIVACFGLLGVSGAIASLATTLFPSESLLSGLMSDLALDAHYLVRLRGAHPIFGVSIGLLISALAYIAHLNSDEKTVFSQRSLRMAVITAIAVMVGLVTLLSLSPVWLKLTHLALTYSLWITTVLWLRSWHYSTSPEETRPERS